jgi:hypothetical protein
MMPFVAKIATEITSTKNPRIFFMVTNEGLLFWYSKHIRVKVIFSEISPTFFQNWTFLKCPKINFSNFIFRHFFQGS